MPTHNDNDEKNELEKKRHQAATDALTIFVSKYLPATAETAETFYTTSEIQKAIADHTGITLDLAEIYELMTNMKYTYEAMNGLEFNWLLKKD